ncbi:guanine nucleotide binding protein, alpha subunit [Mycena amicta]|nr:guanine nucleotide binding protein, alpha subunit [Mycena amicta]
MAGRVFKPPYEREHDPLSAALEPPVDESPEQRQARILHERAAKQASDEIDEQLNRERQHAKKQGKPVKILLLGQSESGKSTTLKNFQLMCEPKAFRAERASWRAIIHLNVIRSVRIILDALIQASTDANMNSPSSFHSVRPDSDLLSLRTRLLPLLQLEDILAERIAHPDANDDSILTVAGPSNPVASSSISRGTPTLFRRRAGKEKELAVNSSVPWMRRSSDMQSMDDWDGPEDPAALLNAASEDLQRLWASPQVREVLLRKGVRLQEESGFFLDELRVVTALRYVPTDEHILRARLKTLGVSEHRMRLNDQNGAITRELRIFDVGGQRSMVTRWVPYFDDMDGIIFLAPISAFDQVLSEDRRVNRLGDSLELWSTITSHRLLQNTNIILFLNKIDLLQAKLAAGISLADYYPAYGRRPNDFDSASKFLKKQFASIFKQKSLVPRMLYCHLTNVIDAKSTTFILIGIKDMLMRLHLKELHLIV